MSPHAAAPPRNFAAMVGPSTATGARISSENRVHCSVSSHSQRSRANTLPPVLSWRRTFRSAAGATVMPAGSRAAARQPAGTASRTASQPKPAPGPRAATTIPAIAGATIVADEEMPPIRLLAAASRAASAISGSTAVLDGAKNPLAQPSATATPSSTPKDAVWVSNVAARVAAAAMRTTVEEIRIRPRAKRSPATPPASDSSRATGP